MQLEEEELLARGREQNVLRVDAGHRDLVAIRRAPLMQQGHALHRDQAQRGGGGLQHVSLAQVGAVDGGRVGVEARQLDLARQGDSATVRHGATR